MSDSPAPIPTGPKAPPAGKLFPCAQCGAKVEFDPRTRSLKCPYCGHETKVPAADADEAVVERDFKEYLEKLEHGGGSTIAGRSSQVRCTGCGAMVLLEDKVVTEKCPYCGTHLENQPESAAEMIPPESLMPFRLDLRAARGAFEKWLGRLWFAPTELKVVANLGQLSGVYVPYWTYDAMTYTRYTGERGEDYQETETYTDRDAQGNEVTKTRTVTKTRWYPVSGEVEHFFDDVLVCGSKSVPPHLVSSLEPWDLQKLEPFRADFLSGFKTERYAVGLREGFDEAKALMEPEITRLIRRDIGGDHQRIHSKRTRYFGITFKHLLLPVWVANYRYRERLFQILINGRTGKVSGERPWSWWKIARLVLLVLLVIALILGLVSYFGGKGGNGTQPTTPPRKAMLDPASGGRERPVPTPNQPAFRSNRGLTPPARADRHANPDALRIIHSAVSNRATTTSVHHDRPSGRDTSVSFVTERAARISGSSPAFDRSNTRPPDADARLSSRATSAVSSFSSSDSGGRTSKTARGDPTGPRRWSAHSGITGSTA
jgi:DNA-directed RNA polymerase subunit RPC12/RpoP